MTKRRNFFSPFQKKNRSTIDTNEHPEKILEELTVATQKSIDFCFPLKEKSKRAKKRSLTSWYDTEIFKGDKKTKKVIQKIC